MSNRSALVPSRAAAVFTLAAAVIALLAVSQLSVPHRTTPVAQLEPSGPVLAAGDASAARRGAVAAGPGASGATNARCVARDQASVPVLAGRVNKALSALCPVLSRFEGWVVVVARDDGSGRLAVAGDERVITIFAAAADVGVSATVAHEIAHLVVAELSREQLDDWCRMRGLAAVEPLAPGDYASGVEDLAESMAMLWTGGSSPFVSPLSASQRGWVSSILSDAGLPADTISGLTA